MAFGALCDDLGVKMRRSLSLALCYLKRGVRGETRATASGPTLPAGGHGCGRGGGRWWLRSTGAYAIARSPCARDENGASIAEWVDAQPTLNPLDTPIHLFKTTHPIRVTPFFIASKTLAHMSADDVQQKHHMPVDLPTPEPESPSLPRGRQPYRFSTLCATVETPNADHKDQHGSSSVPIYQTATFKGVGGQYDYTRSGNPTRTHLGKCHILHVMDCSFVCCGFLVYATSLTVRLQNITSQRYLPPSMLLLSRQAWLAWISSRASSSRATSSSQATISTAVHTVSSPTSAHT